MGKKTLNDPILDLFIYETAQNIEQLETSILAVEKASSFSLDTINEIFRVMHTIKGSSAMMMFDNIAILSHAIEDLFYYIREEKPADMDWALLSDLVLEGVDFIKLEMEKVKNADGLDGDPSELIKSIKAFLSSIKNGGSKAASEIGMNPPVSEHYYLAPDNKGSARGKAYEVMLFFEEGCGMENIRAFAITHRLKDLTEDFSYIPEDIVDNAESAVVIREHGFIISLKTDKSYKELYDFFAGTAYIADFELKELTDAPELEKIEVPKSDEETEVPVKTVKAQSAEQTDGGQAESKSNQHSIISVDVIKLDKLMDLVGEMVIAEAMVTQNPELNALQLNSFYKAARQLRKITGEMQDMVMSIRMVPLSATFRKMNRIVRDVSRKLGKEVEMTLIGEGTEVDKNIIEHISDPLMHLVRNAVDHGIENPNERLAAGKPKIGQVTLEAKNAGSDVLIIVKDDGKGISKELILKKAREQGFVTKEDNELTEKEIYNMICLPGFSTNKDITEFSGRGVGMDVVTRKLEAVGGSVSIDSAEGAGTVTTLKIPLTLAIIDGMNIRVGSSKYTIPTTSIKETFRVEARDLIQDPEGNEMIMVRGQCYPVLRLHKLFAVDGDNTDLTKGILLMIEQDEKCVGLFADELLGQHQVVVKALPSYIKNLKQVAGLAGCTLLGDGSISLILNVGGLLSM